MDSRNANAVGTASETKGQVETAARKPWLTVEEQIKCLKEKGVTFNVMSEEEAIIYLAENNNYFRLGSYRKSFPHYERGTRQGQFISLDFSMLVDLSIVDMLLRRQLLPMTLDIEHFEKMRLMRRIESECEDGYSVIAEFLRANEDVRDGVTSNRIKAEIHRGQSSPYVSDLINKYPEFGFPVWAFMEVIAFGTFIEFYRFCARRFGDKQMQANYYLLQKVRSARNACAHNNCILNNLAAETARYSVPHELSRAVGAVGGIGRDARRSRLSNARLQEIASTFYKHKELASAGVYEHRCDSLRRFRSRMLEHIDSYAGNLQIMSSFDFISKLIDAWY